MIGLLRRRATQWHHWSALLYGAMLAVGGVMVVSIIGIVVEALLQLLLYPCTG